MSWKINCTNPDCGKITTASQIVKLLSPTHCNSDGAFFCEYCKSEGFIKRSFKLQEKGQVWAPYLKGAITLGTVGDTYQPFVFLVSYAPNEAPTDVWFSYYKDTSGEPGGRLKLGHGPGGPPVLNRKQIALLVSRLIKLGNLTPADWEV